MNRSVKLAILQLAARNTREGTREQVREAWKGSARLLLEREPPYLRITSTARAFLITNAGDVERARLEAEGVTPASTTRGVRAHFGGLTTTGAEANERQRRAAAQRRRRAEQRTREASPHRGEVSIPGCGESVERSTLDPGPKKGSGPNAPTFEPLSRSRRQARNQRCRD